jgi:hypothetical protein
MNTKTSTVVVYSMERDVKAATMSMPKVCSGSDPPSQRCEQSVVP